MPPTARSTALALLVALPWLWPLTSGPMAAMLPYLVSAGLAALLLGLWPTRAADGALPAAAGWLLAASLSAVIAWLQYFDLEARFYPWINIAEPGQAFGNLRQPNQLASLLAVGLLALRWLAAERGWRAFAVVAWAGVLVSALAATASRVGLAELLLLGLLAWLWRPAGRSRYRAVGVGLAVLAVYLLAALALPELLAQRGGGAGRDLVDRLQHAESTCGSRLILWRNVLHLIALKPWAGWGWGELDYAHYMTLYDGPRFCHILDNAHNLPLHLAVELGVPVALLACALAAALIWQGQPWRERQPTRQLAWGVLAVIGVHSLVEYPLWYGPFQIAALISLALLWATRPDAAPWGASATGRRTLAVGLLATVGYVAWDYHRVSQIYLPLAERAAPYQDDALAQARRSWVFQDVVRFAELTTHPVTPENAAWMLAAAQQSLHFSPEPRVVTRLIDSAALLGHQDIAEAQRARLRAAFPQEYAQWLADSGRVD